MKKTKIPTATGSSSNPPRSVPVAMMDGKAMSAMSGKQEKKHADAPRAATTTKSDAQATSKKRPIVALEKPSAAPDAKRLVLAVASKGGEEAEAERTPVKRSDVVRAVESLVAHNASRPKKQERLLETENEDVNLFVNIGLKKMPELRTFKGRGVELPHGFRPQANMRSLEICLIVKDKTEARKWLDEGNDPDLKRIKLVSLQQLRTEYATFELKRRLSQTYDVFLADDRVVCMLPKALGKTFYSSAAKRPLPLRLAMTKTKRVEVAAEEEEEEDDDDAEYVNDEAKGPVTKTVKTSTSTPGLKARIERLLGSAFFYLTGSLCAIKVGNLERNTPSQLVDNVLAAIEGAVNKGIPGKWGNVQSVHLKLTKSAALPVYEKL